MHKLIDFETLTLLHLTCLECEEPCASHLCPAWLELEYPREIKKEKEKETGVVEKKNCETCTTPSEKNCKKCVES